MEILGTDTSAIESVGRFLDEWNSPAGYVVAHTSGSTGKPKRIELAKSDMLVSARATNEFFGIGHGELLYMPLSVDYIAGKMMVVRALCAGADLYVEHPSNRLTPPDVSRPLKLACIVPSQIESIISDRWRGRLESVIIGGAPIPPTVESDMSRIDFAAYATYGMTETCSHVALRKIGERLYRTLPHVKVATDRRQCLVVRCPAMSFRKLVTNDIVELVDERTFRWLGRYDNVINSGGIKIHPEEIESRIAPLMQGRSYFIASQSSRQWGSEVVLVVESSEAAGGAIFEKLSAFLDSTEMPKQIVFMPHFERTSSGKINRNATLRVIMDDDNVDRPKFIRLDRRIFKKKP